MLGKIDDIMKQNYVPATIISSDYDYNMDRFKTQLATVKADVTGWMTTNEDDVGQLVDIVG